jgi:hypothetical protein
MRPKTIAVLLAVVCTSIFCGEVPDAPPNCNPGMERGKWLVEAWGNAGSVERIDSKGRKLLRLAFDGGDKEKTAYQHSTGFSIEKDGKISLQIYTDNPLPVSLALLTAANYTWHESNIVQLKPGWNKLEFAVSAPEWKTEATQWKNTTPVVPLGDIRAVDLVINNKDKSGEVYVYGMQYDLDDQAREVAKLAIDLKSDDADIRGAAEKGLISTGRPAIECLSQLAEDEDSQEVQIRAALVLQNLNKAAPAANRVGETLEGMVPVENANEARAQPAVDAGLERTLNRAASKLKEAAARPGAAPENINKAQTELDAIRTELQKLRDRSAALIKSLDENPSGTKAREVGEGMQP